MSRPGAWRLCCIAILLNVACFRFSVCLENNNGNGNGNGNGQILVVGGMTSGVDGLPTITTVLFWAFELALFALVHLMMSRFSGGADLSTMVLVFVAPIITYGHINTKVQNGYSARQIRVNSALKGLFGTTSMDAILDTGASVLATPSWRSTSTPATPTWRSTSTPRARALPGVRAPPDTGTTRGANPGYPCVARPPTRPCARARDCP